MTDRMANMGHLESRRSIRLEATEVLRKSIVIGDLAPETLYSVAQLAERLGVSRTPVREALLELASRGMVQFVKNRGVLIVPPSLDELREIFEVRLLLEVPATLKAVKLASSEVVDELANILKLDAQAGDDKYARQELDRAFHRTLLLQSGNQALVATVDQLRDMVLVRPKDAEERPNPRNFDDDHRAILECVRAGDAEGAASIVEAHLRGAATVIGVTPSMPDLVTPTERTT